MSTAWVLAWLAAVRACPLEPAGPRLVLETAYGDVVLGLYADAAPRHAEQVLRLAQLGAYDTISVYRIARGRYIQLTSARSRREPLDVDQAAALRPLPLEAGLAHVRGALSMARPADNPNGAESSFSILLGPAPHLDGRYTVFGTIDDGWDTLDAIAAADADSGGKPLHRIEITRALVVMPERLAGRPRGRLWRPADPWTQIAVEALLIAVVALGLAGRVLPGGGAGRSAASLASLFASVALVALAIPGSLWSQLAALACVGASAWALRGLDLGEPAPAASAQPGPPAAAPESLKNPFWPEERK